MASPFDTLATVGGAWAGAVISDGTTLATVNNEAQIAAAAAGAFAAVNSVGAVAAVGAGAFAAHRQRLH